MVNVFYPHQHIVVDQPTGDVTVVAGGMPGIPGIPGPPGGVTKEELNLALSGKAPTSHTHTMGQVTGLDTALAGKADQTTMDTRVPPNLALRVDTTVGTRVFAGTTMIYGDTGWRNISDSVLNRWGNAVYPIRIIRIGNIVEIKGYLTQRSTATSDVVLEVPTGFRPKSTSVAGSAVGPVTRNSTGVLIDHSGNMNVNRSEPLGQSDVYFHCIYTTGDAWPTTLPGLPG